MNRQEAARKIEQHLIDGVSKQWCYYLCKIWGVVITESAKHGHVEIVKLLIDVGASVTEYDSLTLRCACEGGHIEIAKLLIGLGAEVNVHRNRTLCVASEHGNFEVVKLLLESGGVVDERVMRWLPYGERRIEIKKLLEEYYEREE